MADFANVAQQIIFDALDGNITGGLYDDAPYLPEGAPREDFPYTVLGDDTLVAWDTDDTIGTDVTVTLHVWSRYGGSKECKTIMGEIYTLLHRATLTKSGYHVVDCLCEFQEVFTEADGETRHGVMRFRLTLQEN